MSRTYKTAPFWVQLNSPERTKIAVYELHDHSAGECDLPNSPLDQHHHYRRTNCSWEWDTLGRNTFCGCNACTGRIERRLKSKENRRRSNERRRNFATDVEFYEEFEDVDSKDGYW